VHPRPGRRDESYKPQLLPGQLQVEVSPQETVQPATQVIWQVLPP